MWNVECILNEVKYNFVWFLKCNTLKFILAVTFAIRLICCLKWGLDWTIFLVFAKIFAFAYLWQDMDSNKSGALESSVKLSRQHSFIDFNFFVDSKQPTCRRFTQVGIASAQVQKCLIYMLYDWRKFDFRWII